MEDSPRSASDSSGLHEIPILVEGLRRNSDTEEPEGAERPTKGTYAERILLPENAPLSALWAKIKALGYDPPNWLQQAEKIWRDANDKLCCHPFEEFEIAQRTPSENAKCINLDEPLIAFTNRHLKEINLNISESGLNDCGTPMESLKDDCGLDISVHHTIRMPDDDKLHQLPGSLGTFPLFNVGAFGQKIPDNMVQQGGVFLPMWQREALWISFTAPYKKKYALRVFVGRINAVSGLTMDERTNEAQGTQLLQDYVVVPGQKWLDGICVAPGIVRQFVAMPLGSGYTVEGQKTGEEKFGGLQIEIIPSYETKLRTWLPEPPGQGPTNNVFDWSRALDELKTPSELGLNPGTKIRSYPSIPTYRTQFAISDLVGTASKENTRVQASYREGAKSLLGFSGFRSRQKSIGSFSLESHSYARAPSAFRGTEHGASASNDDHSGVITTRTKKRSSRRSAHSHDGFDKKVINSSQNCTRQSVPPSTDDVSSNKVLTKDLEAMGLAAGGKLVQDIYRDSNCARIWNVQAARLVNVHILDPASCEKVTHTVPPPPPIDAMGYFEAKMPFFVVEEQVNNRLDGGDLNDVLSVSTMDKERGVTEEPAFDPSKPKMCKECKTRLCDCIVRPCGHQFCNVCIKRLDDGQVSTEQAGRWKCPTCGTDVSFVAGFSAPMNLPGEEALKVKVPVHVLKVEDGRVQFKSIQTTRM